MADFVRDLLGRHPTTFTDYETRDELPEGWHPLVTELVADLVDVLAADPSHRIIVVRMREKLGGLRISYGLEPTLDPGEPLAVVVAVVIAACERRSFDVCDRCGTVGLLRRTPDGVYLTRCRLHAEGSLAIPGGRELLFPASPPFDEATSGVDEANRPTCEDGFTHEICRAVAESVVDVTDADEVPPGWRRTCRDLLADVAALMVGARDHRLELHRLHADERTLRWDVVVPPDVPAIIRFALELSFLRASMEVRWTCRSCGSRDQSALFGDEGCACGRDLPTGSPAQGTWSLPMGPGLHPSSDATAAASSAEDGAAAAGLGDGRVEDGFRMAIYRRTDVAAALGLTTTGPEGPDLRITGDRGDTEQQTRLQRILARGEAGRWRDLARPSEGAIDDVAALAGLAPHLSEVVEHVVRHMRAARAIGLPVLLPPTLLAGPPGVGKTWLLSRVAGLLGVPYRIHPMNVTSSGDSMGGANGVWRNASPGLVARTLLSERHANPIIFVDEFDKGAFHGSMDPFGAFYTLLEPVGARTFVDEYLGFPVDASGILWVASANTVHPIPEPIRDRFVIFDVPTPRADHLLAVADSIYAEANVARRRFFEPHLDPGLRETLVQYPPRSIRMMVEDAMVRAAAEDRRRISSRDVRSREPARQSIGFLRHGLA